MKQFPLRSDRVSLAVTETGGHLSDVVFVLPGGRQVSPMHTAPWADEPLPEDTPPILRVLRGDFFCAPFGSSDLIPGETRVHGLAASGNWRLTGTTGSTVDAVLDGEVLGATVAKHVEVRSGEAVVYQRHRLTGGSGRLPIGHHAMLRAESPLQLAFSPWTMALTPPEPIEVPPHGRPLLAEGQTIADLTRRGAPTAAPRPDRLSDRRRLRGDLDAGRRPLAAVRLDRRDLGGRGLDLVRPQGPADAAADACVDEQWRPRLSAVERPPSPRHRPRGNLRLFPCRPRRLDRRQSGRRQRQPDRRRAWSR